MNAPKYAGLLVRVRRGSGAAFGSTAKDKLGFAAFEPLFPNAGPARANLGLAEAMDEWFVARGDPETVDRPWERAHAALETLGQSFAEGAISYAEPDLEQQFPYSVHADESEAFAAAGRKGEYDPQSGDFPRGPGFAWHLGNPFSELGAARGAAAGPVRILHVDTGYDPKHASVPKNLRAELARDFEGGHEREGAVDPGQRGLLRNPGHGTGTLGILAGNRITASTRQDGEFDGFLGAAPEAEVIPVRIASSVVLFRTSALARALDYALGPYEGPDAAHKKNVQAPVDVVSLSMGGVASAAWAEAVNAAYEAGVCIVAAAGNNFSAGFFGVPTRLIVYPARFRRVIAACGVMADRKPYFGLAFRRMQGNFGPASKMPTALAAFTPNMPWAEWGAPTIVDMNGEGTSSATPQVAAAAALWIAAHRPQLEAYPERWQRVEAVRHALFTSADKTADGGRTEKLGNGILRASDALRVSPPSRVTLTPPDSSSLAVLKILTGIGLNFEPRSTHYAMLALEATQLAQAPASPSVPNPFEDALDDPDVPPSAVPRPKLLRAVEALIDHPRASHPLRDALAAARKELGAAVAVPVEPLPPVTTAAAPAVPADPGSTARAGRAVPTPVFRSLAAYAFDPSLTQRLDTRDIGRFTFHVPWEDLAPGPTGEYLEVVDRDPANESFYAPVDLDHPYLLAQGGLPPSEGTPQFHQQMAYAVASLTILYFERALGRKALWSPGPPPDGANPNDDSRYVQRLRIYPHALREANAYYSPARKALLFGYFRATADDPGEHLPGGFVFTCLSHDIVAHETTHALLDGMHRKFAQATNPDLPALHEAFADVVALLQHFTFPEIVRDQIARSRGALRTQETLLGSLATEFGRATGARGALRDAIGRRDPATGAWRRHVPDPTEYGKTDEPHARGAILVSAIFDAFLAIYERRTRDLMRLATGGSGVLPEGAAIHPDLVGRLADQAARTAEHVLGICIRGLDYCPPVDVTFGEYLRALVTADRDLVPDDDLGYRIAIVEAFRRRAIYPRDVRTLAEESLLWRDPESDPVRPSQRLLDVFKSLRDDARAHLDEISREALFHESRALRRNLHDRIAEVLGDGKVGEKDAEFLGLALGPEVRIGGKDGATLELNGGFEVHAARFADRVGPDGQLVTQCIVELLQRGRVVDSTGEPIPFEGGSTIVVSLREPARSVAVKYVIRKRITSATRLARQRAFLAARAEGTLWGTYFGGRPALVEAEPFAVMHRS